MIGLNCGMGLAEILHPLQRVCATAKPMVVMPNTGGGNEIGGRIFPLSEQSGRTTEFTKRYVELGVRGVGGAAAPRRRICAWPSAPFVAQRRQGTCPHCRRRTAGKGRRAGGQVHGGKIGPGPNWPTARRYAWWKSCRPAPPRACRSSWSVAGNAGPPGWMRWCRMARGPARISVVIAAMLAQRDAGIECLPHYCCRDRS